MNPKNSNLGEIIDILVGVVPTTVIYGNFIILGLVYGMKDLLGFSNPIDQVFLISLGGLLGLAGLVLSLGKFSGSLSLVINSALLIIGIVTVSYVIVSLYCEPDSPDSLFEKIYTAPLFGSLVVGLKRLYLNIWIKSKDFEKV